MDDRPSFIFSVRFLIAIIGFLGYATQYIQRIDMSVGIVCMVNNTALKQQILSSKIGSNLNNANLLLSNQSTTIDSACAIQQKSDSGKPIDGPFIWNKKTQGFILASYFYGYILTQMVGGFLSLKFGAKIVLALAILIGSILTMLIPFAASISAFALMTCRFLTGVAHGAFWPSMSSLWAHWAPPTERSRLVGVANAGSQIGNVVALSLGGFLCVYGFGGGWPSIFYIFGMVGVVWFVLWMALTAKSPAEHRFISEREREYILESTKDAVSGAKPKTPFGEILKSKPFWALVIIHTSSNFGAYLFLTQLPTYMKEVLQFDIKSNGLLSSIPYIMFWVFIIASSIIGDYFIQNEMLSKTSVRKIFNTIGQLVPMTAALGLIFVNCTIPYVGVALLTVALAFIGCAYGAGFMVNYNDIAGSFAGLVFGMANTFGTLGGIIAPYMVGYLTPNQKQEEWRLVFLITAIVFLIGAIGYVLLGSGELQPWAKTNKSRQDPEEHVPLKTQRN